VNNTAICSVDTKTILVFCGSCSPSLKHVIEAPAKPRGTLC